MTILALGTQRQNWKLTNSLLLFNFLIGLIILHTKFIFRCPRLFRKFLILNFHKDQRVPRLEGLITIKSQCSWIIEIRYFLNLVNSNPPWRVLQVGFNQPTFHSRTETLELVLTTTNSCLVAELLRVWPCCAVFSTNSYSASFKKSNLSLQHCSIHKFVLVALSTVLEDVTCYYYHYILSNYNSRGKQT